MFMVLEERRRNEPKAVEISQRATGELWLSTDCGWWNERAESGNEKGYGSKD